MGGTAGGIPDRRRPSAAAPADQLPERGALGQRAKRAVESGAVELVTGFRTAEIRRVGDKAVLEPDLYLVGMKSYGRAPTFLALKAMSRSAASSHDRSGRKPGQHDDGVVSGKLLVLLAH